MSTGATNFRFQFDFTIKAVEFTTPSVCHLSVQFVRGMHPLLLVFAFLLASPSFCMLTWYTFNPLGQKKIETKSLPKASIASRVIKFNEVISLASTMSRPKTGKQYAEKNVRAKR